MTQHFYFIEFVKFAYKQKTEKFNYQFCMHHTQHTKKMFRDIFYPQNQALNNAISITFKAQALDYLQRAKLEISEKTSTPTTLDTLK